MAAYHLFNGSAIVAMTGNKCVGIAADKRFGVGPLTMATSDSKIFSVGPHLYMAIPGLKTDCITVEENILCRKRMYELNENRAISPKVLSAVLSNMLYEKRFGPFFVEPIIAGLDTKTWEPYVCGMDLLGCRNQPNDFVVGGTSTPQLYGMCEAVWLPNLEPDDLFETISQALVNAFDRDAMAGWGADVYIM